MSAIAYQPDAANHDLDAKLDTKLEVEMLETRAPPDYAPEYLTWGLLPTARKFWRAEIICVLAAFGAVFDGYAVSVPGSIIANASFIKVFGTVMGQTGLELDALHVSAWSACQNAGQIAGMFIGPNISDMFGRKLVMWSLTAVLIIAAILEIVAKDWKVYSAAKFLAGCGTGMMQSGITVYIAEAAPTRIRGALLSMYSLAFGIGQLAASVGLQVIATHDNFRQIFYAEFVFVGLFLPALLIAPESHVWYCRKGKEAQAKRTMRWLYGNVESYDMDAEYETMRQHMEEEARNKSTNWFREYLECFQGTNRRRTMISFLPLAFQQFVGLSLFFSYTTYFFQLAGYPKPFEASLIQSCILLASLVGSFFVMDRVGRRYLLLGGGAIMTCCSFSVAGIAFKSVLPGAALVSLACIWTSAYALSVGCTGWAYVADTATARLRAKTTGLAAAGTCIFGLIFQYTTPLMLSPQKANWGLKIGFFYGGLSVLGWFIVFFLVPETRGRTMAELDEMFEKQMPTRQFKSPQLKLRENERS